MILIQSIDFAQHWCLRHIYSSYKRDFIYLKVWRLSMSYIRNEAIVQVMYAQQFVAILIHFRHKESWPSKTRRAECGEGSNPNVNPQCNVLPAGNLQHPP